MADFELELEGYRRVLDSLEELEDQLRGGGPVTVGTGVEYAVYLEFGTSDMDPKPFFRPVLAELRIEGPESFVEKHSQLEAAQIEDLDDLISAVGLTIERRVKEVITRKGLIDTGTLRASVVAIPGSEAGGLPDASEFTGFDGDSPAPASAGRAVVSEPVTIES